MNPKISIIVPVYMVEPYIRKCIDSILIQTFTDFELILVDDGSPDNCGKICDEYAEKENRIKVIHKGNGGLSSARNAGLEIVKGDYIAFVDSDDFIEKDMYEVLYKLAIEHEADVVECGINIINGSNILQIHNHGKTEIGDSIFALEKLLEYGYRNSACNKLYRKDIFDELRYPNKIYEDGFLTYKIFFKLKRYIFIGVCKYNYLQREGSIMSNQKKYSIKNLDGVEVQEERYNFLKTRLKTNSLVNLTGLIFLKGIIHGYKMLQENMEVDPHKKYRNTLRIKLTSYYSEFISNPLAKQYIYIIIFSRLNINIFDKMFSLYAKYFIKLIHIKYTSKSLFNKVKRIYE